MGGLAGQFYSGNLEGCSVSGTVTGVKNVGGLFGAGNGPNIDNSYVTGTVTGAGESVGGLVGSIGQVALIKKSYATCTVTGGPNKVGGLVGNLEQATIMESYASGSVKGQARVGGLVGQNTKSSIENSYATGSVEATNGEVGGLVGLSQLAGAKIENCYAAGQVTPTGTNAGGLVGQNSGTIEKSYYDSETTTQSDTGKGVGKTTEEMKQATTFEGWDSTIWNITDGSYPTLK